MTEDRDMYNVHRCPKVKYKPDPNLDLQDINVISVMLLLLIRFFYFYFTATPYFTFTSKGKITKNCGKLEKKVPKLQFTKVIENYNLNYLYSYKWKIKFIRFCNGYNCNCYKADICFQTNKTNG